MYSISYSSVIHRKSTDSFISASESRTANTAATPASGTVMPWESAKSDSSGALLVTAQVKSN